VAEKVLAGTLLAIAHTRLELFPTEVEGMETADAVRHEKKKDLMNIKTPRVPFFKTESEISSGETSTQ
jgi:hypothetical protein